MPCTSDMDTESHVSIVRPMTTFPTKTGRYPVMHRGRTSGDAYFWTQADADRVNARDGNKVRAGWQQLPAFGVTHWFDVRYVTIPMDAEHVRFWPDKDGFPAPDGERLPVIAPKVDPPKKKNWLQRLFS